MKKRKSQKEKNENLNQTQLRIMLMMIILIQQTFQRKECENEIRTYRNMILIHIIIQIIMLRMNIRHI